MITVLKSKIHRAKVTRADLHYEGSISICPALLRASGIRPYEQVDVAVIESGARFTTYALVGQPGEIGVNGAAARLAQAGDLVIIMCYRTIDEDAPTPEPALIFPGEGNALP